MRGALVFANTRTAITFRGSAIDLSKFNSKRCEDLSLFDGETMGRLEILSLVAEVNEAHLFLHTSAQINWMVRLSEDLLLPLTSRGLVASTMYRLVS